MLSQKLSRIGFKMADLEEYERLKHRRSDKAMDTTPELKLGAVASNSGFKTPRKTLANLPPSNRSTPGAGMGASLRSSTPDLEQ